MGCPEARPLLIKAVWFKFKAVKTRFWGRGKSRNPGCCPRRGHLPPNWRCRGTGTPPGRAGGAAVPGPTTQTRSFQGKAGKSIPRDWGAPAGRACLLAPVLPPAGGAPVLRDGEKFVSGAEPQRAFPGVPGTPRLGDPKSRDGGRVALGWGQTDRGQMTNSVLILFPMPTLPTRAALPRPATPEATSRGTRCGGHLAVPRLRAGPSGFGQREQRTRDGEARDTGTRCGSGTGAGLGLRAPRRSLTTGTCWEWDGAAAPLLAGLPAVRALLSLLFLLLLFFFLSFFFSLPTFFPPLSPRWSLEMDGKAGRLTLALPLCPVPPARPPSRQTRTSPVLPGQGD